MRSFTWVNLLAKKVRLISSVLMLSVGIVRADSQVANITKENCDNLKIRDLSQANAEIGDFKIEILNDTIRLTDMGLEFDVKIASPIEGSIKYEDKEIEVSEKGRIFSVCIAVEQLSNKPFWKVLKFSSDNHDLRFDEAKLMIEPIIELKTEDKPLINFGKLLWKQGRIKSTDSPNIRFSYSILKNTTCKIESKNGFKLKHEDKDEFIEYLIEIQHAEIKKLNDKEKEFMLNSKQKNFLVQFNVDSLIQNIPSRGNWKDTVVFSIVCEK